MPIKYITYTIQAKLDVPEQSIVQGGEAIKNKLIYAVQQQHPHWAFDALEVTTQSKDAKP